MTNKWIVNVLVAFSLVFLLACSKGLETLNQIGIDRIANVGEKIVTGNELTLDQQKAVGTELAAGLIGTSRVHPSEKLQKYVNRVGKWVAMHSSVAQDKGYNFEWQFIVIDTPDFNAFATPGGFVIISSGVIDRLSSEAELAAVLAHEIIHVEQDHQVNAIQSSNRLAGLGDLALMVADNNQRGNYDSGYYAKRQFAKGIGKIFDNLYTKGLSRDDELDADRKAVVLMSRAGYDPYAYLTVMQITQSIDTGKTALLFKTHPKPADRLQAASESLQYVNPHVADTKNVEKRFYLFNH